MSNSIKIRKAKDGERKHNRALLTTTALGSSLCLAIMGFMPAVARAASQPQDSASIDSSTKSGASFINQGADYTDYLPADGGGIDGGDAHGWSVDAKQGVQMNAPVNGPLLAIHSIGGNGSQGADTGSASTGAAGGKGGDSGNVDFTLESPADNGAISYFLQQSGGKGVDAIDIQTIGGNGGKGQTPGGESENGGPAGQAGVAGNINFTAYQNSNAPYAYNELGTGAGSPAINLYSKGGNGGAGGDTQHELDATGPAGAVGAKGGDITANISLNVKDTSGFGIQATSQGGNGGNGGQGGSTFASGTAGPGAAGGDGGNVTINQWGGSIATVGSGTVSQVGVDRPNDPDPSHPTPVNVSLENVDAAILAQSIGGAGGSDGGADGLTGSGGKGGAAGNGGTISVNLSGSGIYQTNGGFGQFRDQGAISTTGDNAVGIVASSVGGSGGGTQDVGGAFAKKGGGGGVGGNGGLAYVSLGQQQTIDPSNDYTLITTNGAQSDGVIVQSIGGGGGIGGDVHGGGVGFTVQHGGAGGGGGLGGSAGIDNGFWSGSTFAKPYQIHTLGTDSFGILVQSIGGGGGRGGNADGIAAGAGSLVIGGSGGLGGNAADTTIRNYGIIQTEGDQSIGALAQSIGGGGGAGGSALAVTVGSVLTSATAVGGTGGVGGNGNLAQIYNFGQVETAGANATGLVVQSIGGGGGNGGSSLAEAFAINPPDSPLPSFTLDLALGGQGGAGGLGGLAKLYNSGLIATQGDSSFGVFAQSVGGGGGNGGDATAMSQSYIQSDLQANVAIGGKAADGSAGNTVTVANSGLIQTLGQGSGGVFAQSVGGGGGNGGFGKTNQGSMSESENPSLQVSVGIGGTGGTGGDGGDVNVYNYISTSNYPSGSDPNATKFGNGGILTAGISAPGIFGQSVGGGGGNGADAIGAGGGGKINFNLALGGSGGAGGNGGNVTVDNGNGVILTAGANSPGVFAQSVGGGGGNGGNATTSSGNDPKEYYPKWLATQGAQALGNTTVTQIATNFWDWKKQATDAYDNLDKLKELYEGYQSDNDKVAPAPEGSENQSTNIKIDIGAGRAGSGGGAGDGGIVNAFNDGSIVTMGPGSTGMFGQSVGGGGGTGGAATAASTNDKPDTNTFAAAIAIGGANGSTGNGGIVNLANGDMNTHDALILTEQDLSQGMYGLSVGGGGGVGGASTSTAKAPGGLSIVLGADASSGGAGGSVQLTNDAQIVTQGNDSYAMLAQSIGGGGGFASITGQQTDPNTGLIVSSTQVLGAPVKVQLTNPGAGSSGGAVTVDLNASGVITTGSVDSNGGQRGINSYGIMAQSIGGGGGIFVVDPNNGSKASCDLFQSCDNQHVNQNDGGLVTVNTQKGSTITTTGAGAAGIVAQSIGGGGADINGLNGIDLLNLSHLTDSVPSRGDSAKDWNAGNAGSINIQANGDITTTGDYAHGIFAQSAANGGGMVGKADGSGFLFFGQQSTNAAACTSDCSAITIGVGRADGKDASKISVSGAHAYGVAAISIGGVKGTNNVSIDVGPNALILAKGNAAGAILIEAQDKAVVTNEGVIDASASANHVAIQGWNGIELNPGHPNDGYDISSYAVFNSGTILGNVAGGGSIDGKLPIVTFTNQAGGVFEAGNTVDLGGGQLINHGTVSIGASGAVARTVLNGDFIQGSDGVLKVDYDGKAGANDVLAVTGKATLDGQVQLAPTALHKDGPITVLTAAGGVSTAQAPVAAVPGPPTPYTTTQSVTGVSLQEQINADFNGAAADLGQTQKAVARHLQQVWDHGNRLDTGFTALYGVNDDHAAYASALNSMSGQALGALNAVRYRNGQTFATNMLSGCPDGTDEMGRCVWGRVSDTHTRQGATADAAGYTVDATSSQAGASIPLTSHLTLSGSMGFTTSTLTGDYASTIQGTEWRFGGMLTYNTGRWELSGAVDGSHGDYNSNRNIVIGKTTLTAKSSPELSDVGAHFRVAYDQSVGAWSMKPYVDLHASQKFNSAFSETGAQDLNLAVESESDTVLAADAGIEVSGRQVKVGHGLTLKPFFSASEEAVNNGNWAAVSRFVGQDGTDGFKAVTPLPTLLTQVNAGAELASGSKWNLRLDYGAQFAEGYTSQTGSLRLAVKF